MKLNYYESVIIILLWHREFHQNGTTLQNFTYKTPITSYKNISMKKEDFTKKIVYYYLGTDKASVWKWATPPGCQ